MIFTKREFTLIFSFVLSIIVLIFETFKYILKSGIFKYLDCFIQSGKACPVVIPTHFFSNKNRPFFVKLLIG